MSYSDVVKRLRQLSDEIDYIRRVIRVESPRCVYDPEVRLDTCLYVCLSRLETAIDLASILHWREDRLKNP